MYAEVIAAKDNLYTLQILDETKMKNMSYPQYPGIKSEMPLKKGDIVAVIFLYGGNNVYIIGKA